MLDEGAKAWLASIEAKKKELDQLVPVMKVEARRNERLRSFGGRRASDATLQVLAERKLACEQFIAAETSLFYKNVFGIEMHHAVAVRKRNGVLSSALFVTQVIARQLSNGMGVFTVTGDSVAADMHKGLPACEYLMALESDDDWLVAVA